MMDTATEVTAILRGYGLTSAMCDVHGLARRDIHLRHDSHAPTLRLVCTDHVIIDVERVLGVDLPDARIHQLVTVGDLMRLAEDIYLPAISHGKVVPLRRRAA